LYENNQLERQLMAAPSAQLMSPSYTQELPTKAPRNLSQSCSLMESNAAATAMLLSSDNKLEKQQLMTPLAPSFPSRPPAQEAPTPPTVTQKYQHTHITTRLSIHLDDATLFEF
jgi:hypothetical protein